MANLVYILEPQWNPTVEEQAIARVLRLGQKKNVWVIRYIMRSTIEEVRLSIHEIVSGPEKADLLVGHAYPTRAKIGTCTSRMGSRVCVLSSLSLTIEMHKKRLDTLQQRGDVLRRAGNVGHQSEGNVRFLFHNSTTSPTGQPVPFVTFVQSTLHGALVGGFRGLDGQVCGLHEGTVL